MGDRHLQNFLVELSSGALVPIDFGYSFGTAAMVLPIPELLPFRLTRQMANALAPHDAVALLVPAMAAVLAALQEGMAKRVLEAMLAIFLAEPLLDWQKEATILAQVRDSVLDMLHDT